MADETLMRELARPPPAPLSDLAQAIHRLRRSYGETQVQFARRIGVHPHTLERWERGHTRPWPFVAWLVTELAASRAPPVP